MLSFFNQSTGIQEFLRQPYVLGSLPIEKLSYLVQKSENYFHQSESTGVWDELFFRTYLKRMYPIYWKIKTQAKWLHWRIFPPCPFGWLTQLLRLWGYIEYFNEMKSMLCLYRESIMDIERVINRFYCNNYIKQYILNI